ncbi:MAG: hypothetical protein D6714_06760 [Bacteroidetes bacterium]|nr:MAG: hypothetical protein D6714_06760 [Bacteroidota bacterium]
MKKIGIYMLCVLFAAGCRNEEKQIREQAKNSVDSLMSVENLKKTIVGNWETVSFKVDVRTANNTDSSYSFYVGRNEWEQKLNMHPFQTFFRENNTYSMQIMSAADSLVDTRRGLWSVFGDTLMLIEADGSYQYRVRAKNKYLQFESLLDWDGDGQEDDAYMRLEARKD